jgi:hypothetical protein
MVRPCRGRENWLWWTRSDRAAVTFLTDRGPVGIYKDVDGTRDALIAQGQRIDPRRNSLAWRLKRRFNQLSPGGFRMSCSPFSPISSLQAPRRMAGVVVSGAASVRALTAVMLVVAGAGHSVSAASSDDVDRMLGAVSAQAVKLRKCYENKLDFDRTLSCKTRNEIIASAERGCWAAETDLRIAIMKSAAPAQRASIASLTAAVLDAVRGPVEAAISEDAHREIPFDCLVQPISH